MWKIQKLTTNIKNLAIVSGSAVLMTLGISTSAMAAILYDLIEIGTLPGESYSIAKDINNFGHVVGDSGKRAFIWSRETGLTDIGSLSNEYFNNNTALAINNSGQVVGMSTTTSSGPGEIYSRAFLWSRETGITDFSRLSGYSGNNFAIDINDLGQVVGTNQRDEVGSTAFLWSREAGFTELSNLVPAGEYETSSARAINNLGEIIGFASGNSYIDFLLSPSGHITEISRLPISVASEAIDINDLGQVVGTSLYVGIGPNGEDISTNFEDGFRAFLWSRNSGITAIETLPGYEYNLATSINNLGQVVGYSYSYTTESPDPAFFWSKSTGTLNLNNLIDSSLGWTLYEASAINDQGQIVGYGLNQNGERRGFLLTPRDAEPVPEPITMGGTLLAGVGLAYLRRQRRLRSSQVTE